MSGPFRFHQEEARSPLDRSASPFSAGQPVSFKTNVNRAKTKKWVQAKKNAYDGDDWGEYDEYDEYGVNQEPQQAQPRYYAQHLDQPLRSFTDPSHQAPLLRAHRNSFEQGEEQRAFSSTIPHSQHGHVQPYEESRGPAGAVAFGQDYDTGGRGDFSLTAVPPPLQTRISQVPVDFTPPSNTQFPPRKSSIGQGDLPTGTSPRPRNGSGSNKPLPFIRPADIYKRHQDERTSLDSSRPSLDSFSSASRDDTALGQEGGKSLHPMETVAERKSEYLADYDATATQNDAQPHHQERPVVSPSDDQGLRSVVDQAFTRTDDSRSVPPTPISNDSSSDLLRSNTGSTSGISPIMSRVPSSAASALKNRNQIEGNTPVIAEEPSETTTPVTRPTSAHNIEAIHYVPRKSSPGHSRNFSSSSTPRSGLATPTRGDSPARSPILAPSRDVPEPRSALFSTADNDNSGDMEGGLQGPSSAYAAREADLAIQMRSRPNSGAPDLGATERQSQTMFLDSHNAQSPIDDVLPRDRSESPSKGRVQALAGKFGEVASSRRESIQSNRSRNSIQSWERSHDNSRAASPTKASSSKPSSPVKEFRPHLPGQWESYATTAMTPSEQGEQDRGLSTANNNSHNNSQTALEQSDLMPTAVKQSVAEGTPLDANDSDPMAALRNAGAAVVDSIRMTLGVDEHASESQHHQKERGDYGNVYLPRPLQFDRTITSNSSAPPTPHAKDTPGHELAPPAPLKERPSQHFESQLDRPSLDPQLSTDPSTEDQESDRLRKEIVASLSPFKAPDSPVGEPNDAKLLPANPSTDRASSILPSEYKSYWAEEDCAPRRSSQDSKHSAQEQPSATVAFLPQSEEPTQPIIKRFSWEASSSQLQMPDDKAEKAPMTETTVAAQEPKESSPAVERSSEQDCQQRSEGAPDSYFGTDHTLTVTKFMPLGDPEKLVQPSPPLGPTHSVISPTREGAHLPGLHVVNTELNPEAVDLAPRFSADNESPQLSEESILSEKQLLEPAEQHPAVESPSNQPKVSTSGQGSSDAKSPTTDKPWGAREIATLNSAAERIDTCNKTRDYWATVDHGLNDWLTATLEANPELATHNFPTQRVPTASARHRHTGSLALFGKFAGSSSIDLSSDQHNTASAPTPASTSSPTAGAPSGPGFGGRIANQQMQLKGKDLLHTANVLGGKGMTSAKGLFAKGKSRFGREKASSHTRTDSAPSSREVSEEPELVTTRPKAQTVLSAALMRSVTEKEKERELPNEEKKKRRFSFSSQFRRASRSRSGPSSVSLPSDASSTVSTAPKTSPPRELHHFLMGDRRPNSFHAPDSWASHPGVPPTALNKFFNITPPRRSSSQPRLGIHPSPAKSAFSGQDGDTKHHVPPVPPIPDKVAIKHYRRRSSQDSASHQMLESTIRHSTPPIVPSRQSTPSVVTNERRSLAHAPVLTNDTQSGAEERAEDYKSLLRAPEGSFQPDLPTAESENPHNKGFRFEFAEKAPTGPTKVDDNDDQPPMLNHHPLPAPTPPERHPFFVNRHMDVSDEDSDDKPSRGRSISTLPAPKVEPEADSVSPAIPPFMALPDSPTISEESTEAKPDDTSVNSVRQHLGNVGQPSVDLGEGTSNITKRSPSQARYPESMSPVAVHRQRDELAVVEGQVGSKDRTSMVESPVLGYYGENVRTGEAQEDSPFEPGASRVRDFSYAFDALSGSEETDATTKPEKQDAERASSPIWFTKKDLELPTADSALNQKEIFSHEGIENTIIPQDPDSRAVGVITAPDQQLGATRTDGEASLSPDPVANADTSHTRRIVTSHSHAVQENAISSAASCRHRDTTHISHSDANTSGEMNDEGSFVTPFAPVPHIVQSGPEPPKPGTSHDDNSRSAIPNGHARMQDGFPDFKHQAQQLQASSNAMPAPERSRSLLSQISAMVSEEGSAPYSQVSTGRSTPSTIRRMQPESFTKPSIAPAQIPEEAPSSHGDRSFNGEDDDFDLYADHNGIVKDMQDENGQPLRLTEPQTSSLAPQPQLMKPSAPSIGTAPGSRDGDRPRYSTERPMSFISGPADQDGMPQDQINRVETPEDMKAPPEPQQHRNQIEQHYPPPTGTVYSTNPPSHSNQLWNHDQSLHQPPPALDSHPTKNIFRAVKSIDPAGKTAPTPIDHSYPSTQANSQQVRPEMANTHGRPLQDNQIANQALHEPLAQQDHPVPRGVSDLPPGQSSYRDSGYSAPNQGPRNHYELQQQTQLQASHPHPQTIRNQQLPDPTQPLVHEAPRPHEKPSSNPRLSSMFKDFGGKSQGDLQQQSSTGNMTTDPSLKPLPADPNPHTPSHSIASCVVPPREASTETQKRLRSFAPPTRPNIGQQSHFSQGLQFDPKNSTSSVPSSGIPYHQPSSASNMQSQVHQAPQADKPEGGKKKKRFSGLGALFGRGGAGGDSRATKLKLSKEDKKAKKAEQDHFAASAKPLPQWITQQQPPRPQHSGMVYYPPGQLPPHTVQGMSSAGPKYEPPRFAPDMYSQRLSQQVTTPRQSMSSTRPDERSAFLGTKQLAEEHQAQQKSRQSLQATFPTAGFSAQNPATLFDRVPLHLRQGNQGPTSGDSYKPDVEHASKEREAYFATLTAQQQHELQRQRESLRERDIYAATQAEKRQTLRQRQPSAYEQSDYRDIRYKQQQAQEQAPHHSSDQWTHEAWLGQPQQIQREQEHFTSQHAKASFSDHHQSPQRGQHQYPPHTIHHESANPHPPFMPRSVSGLGYHGTSQDVAPVSPPAGSTLSEPRYEAPPIPAAYSQVSGAFISPLDRQQRPVSSFHQDQPIHAPHDNVGRQYSDPRMQAISPQVSAQSQVRPNDRLHSEASTMSIVSPISNSPAISSSSPLGIQQIHKPRMNSISEVQQPGRPWHLNFPAGATEQEIVRARQGQYMQELFNAQQQQQAERAAGSPSPRASPKKVTPTVATSPNHSQDGGYQEILPRNSPQPYVLPQSASSHHGGSFIPHHDPTREQSASVLPGQSPQAAAHPLPMSRDSTGVTSPFNPIAVGLSAPPLPPPKIPYTPMGPAFPDAQLSSISGNHPQRSSSSNHDYLMPQYDEQVPDEAPPSYDSPGLPNDGMNKSRPDAFRPPNIVTNMDEDRGRQTDSRPRQASIGMMVHPQPASMAASPQRTTSDMGAESLRRQLLQQENLVRMEHVQREQEQREALERESQEREAARARARELERSASGGGQVGSLRSVHGGPNASAPGWERRGSSHNRPVFELPAVEDDEPTMKATSYPGQEWVPPMWDGD